MVVKPAERLARLDSLHSFYRDNKMFWSLFCNSLTFLRWRFEFRRKFTAIRSSVDHVDLGLVQHAAGAFTVPNAHLLFSGQ